MLFLSPLILGIHRIQLTGTVVQHGLVLGVVARSTLICVALISMIINGLHFYLFDKTKAALLSCNNLLRRFIAKRNLSYYCKDLKTYRKLAEESFFKVLEVPRKITRFDAFPVLGSF